MDGFEKYSEIFIERAKELLEKDKLNDNPEYQKVFMNNLLGISGPKHLKREITPPDHFFSALYNGFREISDSYYSLLDIETYIGRFPFSKTKISKVRHMIYHLECYLNEVYILKERIKAYITKVGRLYKKDPKHSEVLKKMRPLFPLIDNALDNIVKARGSHVHESRFKDDDLDRISSLEFFAQHGGEELRLFRNLFIFDYLIIRRKYKKTLVNNNKEIRKLLDACFDILYGIVTLQDGKFHYPKGIKAQPTTGRGAR